jgi:hypothetical protein
MPFEKTEWVPLTGLGKEVVSGQITSIDQVLESGRPIKEPEIVMQNIERVTNHLRKRIISEGGDILRSTINLIPTLDGKSFYP